MALADFVVIEVVCRCDFHATAAEFLVDIVISDHRNAAAGERQLNLFTDEGLITLILGIHRHGTVAKQGFRASGGHHQIVLAARDRVTDVPQRSGFFFGNNFEIGDGGVQHRVPVHQALAAIDQAFFVQAHEHFRDRLRQARVHGEALARPIERGAHAPQLLGDGAAGLRLPFPHALEKCFAPEVVARLAFGFELALDHHLGGDAGVIGACLPQCVVAAHAVVAGERVHDRVLERMPHVQAAGDIRRRDHDAVARTLSGRAEGAGLFPGVVQTLFDRVRLVGLVQRRGTVGW